MCSQLTQQFQYCFKLANIFMHPLTRALVQIAHTAINYAQIPRLIVTKQSVQLNS